MDNSFNVWHEAGEVICSIFVKLKSCFFISEKRNGRYLLLLVFFDYQDPILERSLRCSPSFTNLIYALKWAFASYIVSLLISLQPTSRA